MILKSCGQHSMWVELKVTTKRYLIQQKGRLFQVAFFSHRFKHMSQMFFLSFCLTIFMLSSYTDTRIVVIVGGRTNTPTLLPFPNLFRKVLHRVFFPAAIVPMGDKTGFVSGEPLALQSRSVFNWEVILSTLLGALVLAIAIIWKHLTSVLAYELIPRRWPHPPCQGVVKLYPRMLLLPFVKLMVLAP